MRSSHLGILATLLVAVLGLLAYLVFADGATFDGDSREVFGAGGSAAVELDQAGEFPRAATGKGEDRVGLVPVEEEAVSEAATLTDLSLRGRVLSSSGVPLSDVRVLVEANLGWFSIPLGVELISGITQWRDLNETSTDEVGEFSFDELDSGTYVIEILDEEHRPSRLEKVSYAKDKGLDLGDLSLESGAVLRGQVLDERGRGVVGALLLESLGHPREEKQTVIPGRGRPIGESGANGQFLLANLAPGELHVIVDSPEHFPVEVETQAVLAGETQEDLIVRVETGLPLEGRVQGVAPEQLSRLRITARIKNESSTVDDEPASSRPRTVPCEASGAFRIGGLVGGQDYRLTAFETAADEEGELERLPAIDAVYARPGDSGVVLSLKKPLKLSVRVVNDATGEPVTSFTALAGFEELTTLKEDGETKHIHAGGWVQFEKLQRPEGQKLARVVIRAVGFAELEKGNLQLKEGEENDLGEVRLIPAPRLLVTVTDKESGRVIPSAYALTGNSESKQTLEQLADAGPKEAPVLQADFSGAPADEDGVVALGLITGEASWLYVVADGFATLEFPQQHFRGIEDVELAAELVRGGEVRVQVTDQLGGPVEGVTVLHSQLEKADQSPQWLQVKAEWKTDEAGEVVFGSLSSGDHGFRLLKEEEVGSYVVLSPEDEWQSIAVKSGESAELVLTTLSRSSLSGTVFESGAPLAEADLTLVALENGEPRGQRWRRGGFGTPSDDPNQASTDEEGHFQFSKVKPGDYLVRVSHVDRYMTIEVPVTMQVEPTELDVRLGVASIEGRITDSEGAPLEGIVVRADTESGARTRTWNRGKFQIGEDEEGSMTFNMSSSPGRSRSSGAADSEARTDSDGRYVLRGVRSDEPIDLDIRDRFHSSVSEQLDALGPDEVRRGVDFALEPAGVITCKIAALPEGVNRIRVRAEYLEEGAHLGESRQRSIRTWNLRAGFESLLPGRWKLEVRLQDGTVVQTLEPQVVAGQITELSIDLL